MERRLKEVNACVMPSDPVPDNLATMAYTVKVTADIDIMGIISMKN
jgi:hypothetical protein